ncbi:hypothetical protein HNY73_010776 [Argiope bruennichi]|uniref:Uncharacterized protein n=1 Tax=Argiope bruennichi TaxID=94029 RepID=A0A8T0F888_ARGBR|nr:hypothetical protein HNY73_010776 [Argiope bruennichi]
MLNNFGNRSAAQRTKMNWICVSSSNVCKQAELTRGKNQALGCVIRKSTRELPMRMFGPMREKGVCQPPIPAPIPSADAFDIRTESAF